MSSTNAAPRALILFAHGSRDPDWARPVRALASRVQATRPDLVVADAYLEFMAPSLAEAVDRLAAGGSRAIAIAPLFLGQGSHLKRDLAQAVERLRAAHPAIAFTLLPSLGESDAVLEAIAACLVAATPR